MAHRQVFSQAWLHLKDELVQQCEIEALLPSRQVVAEHLRVEHIRPNPFQVRSHTTNLQELVQVIRTQGLAIRLRVRPDPSEPGYFQLMYGEHWLLAARDAGMVVVPCDIGAYTDEELLEIGLMENIKRCNLDPLEEAFALRTIVEQRGYSIAGLAQLVGKDHTYIRQRLELLALPYDTLTPGSSAVDKTHGDDSRTQTATGATAKNGSAARPGTTSPHEVEHDIHTLRTILARWRDTLAHKHSPEKTAILRYLDELTSEIKQLVARR